MAHKVFELLLLLMLCISSIWSLDICEDQLNGAQLLHPLDCSKYIVCRFGATYRIETCDGGRHFNRFTAECVDPLEAACDVGLIKDQLALSNECDTCRSICGCASQTECSTPSSSTPDTSPHTSSSITPGEDTTNSPSPVTPGLETSSSTTSSPDSSSSSPSSSTEQISSTPATSSETTVGSHSSSGSTETTPHAGSEITETSTTSGNSEVTSSSTTSPAVTETTPNTSSSNSSVTPGLDTSSEATETTLPNENSSPTPHIPSPSTTGTASTRPNTPNPDVSSSISPGSTTVSASSVSSTSETTSIPSKPDTTTSATPSTSSCTNTLEICVGKPNFQIIYVPGSCREYAICIDDCANVLSCPNNLLYDLENHVCTYPQNVNCPYEVTPPSGPSAGPSGTKCESHGKCENQPDGTLFADDSNGGYIVCQCECEVARPCPGGLVFNNESQVCDFPIIN